MNDSRKGRPQTGSSNAPKKAGGGGGPPKGVDVKVLVAEGRDAVDSGDIKAARKALNSAQSRAPKDRGVLLLKALVLCAEDNGEAALDALDEAMVLFDDDVALVATKAFILLDVIGDPEEALPLLEECIDYCAEHEGGASQDGEELDGLRVELGLRLVDALLALGDVNAAIAAGKNVVDLTAGSEDHPEDEALARASLARALLAAGDVDGARREAALAVKGDVEVAEVHAVFGRVAVVVGDEEGAARAFARAHALDAEGGLPPKLDAAAFKARFDAVVRAFPEPLRGYVTSLPITFAPRADVERLKGLQRSPETPMLFDGDIRKSTAEGGSADPFAHKPTAVVVYQRSLETLCRSDAELDELITAVVVEGVGMFLGLEFDEDLKDFAEAADEDDDE